MKIFLNLWKCSLSLALMFAATFVIAQTPSQIAIDLDYASGAWDNEVGWELIDAGATTSYGSYLSGQPRFTPFSTTACISPGTAVELYTYESFGDGWDSSVLTVSSGGNVIATVNNANDPSGNGTLTASPQGTGLLSWSATLAVDCVLDCPADLTVSTAPGLCVPGFSTIPMPTASAACATLTASGACSTVVSGASSPLLFVGGNLVDTSYDIPGVPTTATHNVTLNGSWSSDNSGESPNLFLEGYFVGKLPAGGIDCMPNDLDIEIPVAEYNTAASDGVLNFMIMANADVNEICASNFIILEVSAPQCLLAGPINDYNGTEDASDIYPIGTTTVTWTTTDVATGFEVKCTHTVTVDDLEPPMLTCPGDQTISLDAGECEAVFNYAVTATENCPGVMTSINQNDGTWPPPVGGGIVCSNVAADVISYWRIFDLGTISADLESIDLGWDNRDGSDATIRVHQFNGNIAAPSVNDMTLLSTTIVTPAPNSAANVILNHLVGGQVSGVIAVEVETVSGGATGGLIHGFDLSGEAMPTYVLGCNTTIPGLFPDLTNMDAFFTRGWIIQLNLNAPAFTLTQTLGPDSGESLPIGETCYAWEAVDANGNVAMCDWCVEVIEFPEALQSTTLTCNNHVNISVDDACAVVLGADMFLEGGPYGCYESYNVTVSGVPGNAVVGNGTSSVTINAGSIPGWNGMAGPFTVSVSDPDNNNNSCWGTFMLEDKLAPTVTCDTVTVTCVARTFPNTLRETGTVTVDAVDPGISWADGVTGPVGSYSIPVSGIPPGAILTDVTVDMGMDHSWIGDITVDLANANGASTQVFTGTCGNSDNVNAIFSTTSTTGLVCTGGIVTPAPHETCTGGHLTDAAISGGPYGFNGGDLIGGPVSGLTLNINDGVGGDGGCISRLGFSISWELLPVGVAVADDNCNTPTLLNGRLTYKDAVTTDQCTDDVITRTWVAVDLKGNSSSCVQIINIENISIADISLPAELVELPGCGASGSPEDIATAFDNPLTQDNLGSTDIVENHEGYDEAYPYYVVAGHNQKVDNTVCSIIAYYSDQTIPACDPSCASAGTQKIVRTWDLLDWCTLETAQHVQIIKATDNEAPVITATDLTISTDPWSCVAYPVLPAPTLIHDNCTSYNAPYVLGDDYQVSGPAGWSTVGLEKSMDNDGDGQLDPYVFTYTSTDCCGNQGTTTINVIVADLAPPVAIAKQNIILSLTAGQGQGADAAAKLFAHQVDNGSYDGCGSIKVEIRRPIGGHCGNLGNNNYNNNLTFNNTFGQLGDNASDTDNGAFVKFCCADATGNMETLPSGATVTYGLHEVIMRVYDDANMDFIPGNLGDNYNETWIWVRVENKLPPVINCTDSVLECYEDSSVLEEVDATTGAKTYTSLNTALPTVSGVCSNVCYVLIGDSDLTGPCGDGTIIRTWGVDGNCDGNVDGATCTQFITVNPSTDVFTGPVIFPNDISTSDCNQVFNPVKPTWTDGLCDLVGWTHEDETFEVEPGACFKIIRTYTVINWCTGQEWEGEQVIKYVDETAPEMTCTDVCYPGDALDANGDPLCGRFVSLTKTAVDTLSSCNSDWLDWYVTVDLWSDGTIDWIFTTSQQANASSLDNILPIPGANTTVSISIPEFVANSCYDHTVVWTANDKCNNVVACTELFQVEDKKAPTPYCISVSSATMVSGSVELWASDFNLDSFDDCTPKSDLLYSFSGTSYVPNRTFTCADDADGDGIVNVAVWVWDDACTPNNDFCNVELILSNCGTGGVSRIGGTFATEAGEEVEEVHTNLQSDNMIQDKDMMTDNAGHYAFDDLVENFDYEVSGEKNDDYMNGVSTLDLVLIQKHILQLNTLNSPYKMIAADINSSGTITALDLVELRKLILGIYAELPSNDSWRFVDGSQTLTTSNPWVFTEVIEVNNLTSDKMYEDFVAVKVGDVNGSVTANVASITTESRTENNLTLEVEALDLEAGETTTIEVLSSNFTDVYGYQMTMNVEGMTINSVEGVSLELTDANVSVMSDRMTMSYHSSKSVTASKDEVLFTMNVTATQSGSLSTMMNINSTVTKAEAYFGNDLNVGNVELGVRGDAGVTVVDGYELFQNEPNPFKGSTQISFRMAESSSATITVYDVTGKVISINTEVYPKGYNTVSYNKSDLGSVSGVLYYQLESGDFMATKKMIVIE